MSSSLPSVAYGWRPGVNDWGGGASASCTVVLESRVCTAVRVQYNRQVQEQEFDKKQTKFLAHSKPRPAPYCRVLPPGGFNSVIPETVSFYPYVEQVYHSRYDR